jgi:hypothetical protein
VAKKRFVVKPRTPQAMERGLQTTKGNIGFNGKTQKILTDESLAREIDAEYGVQGGKRQVYVYEDERLAWHDHHDKGTDGMDHETGTHHYTFSGVDTSHFKVWVLKRGKLVRTTKAKAKEKGYTIVADTKKRPDPQQFRNAQATEARNGLQRE